MRPEKEMFDLILGIARRDDRIRAVSLTGSRADPNAVKDIFQDFDIVYLVTETGSFIKDNSWIRIFGDILIMQLPDELGAIAGHKTDIDRDYGYLMQFTDGVRIDLHIKTLDAVLEDYKSGVMLITLLDKDTVLPETPPPSDREYWVRRPRQEEFSACCNEFWWVALYPAKGLWRKEILYAMDNIHVYLRPELIKMLSWYAGTLTDFAVSTGKCAKNLYRYIPAEMYRELLNTYSGAQIDAVWNSLSILCVLFHETAQKTAAALGFLYDTGEAEKSYAYLKHIRQLPEDASEIR